MGEGGCAFARSASGAPVSVRRPSPVRWPAEPVPRRTRFCGAVGHQEGFVGQETPIGAL